MSNDKQIETTDWLTRGIPKEQLEREKREAIFSNDLQGCFAEFSFDFDAIAEKMVSGGYLKMPDNIGEFSDGYHTFNELYHHRAVLFSVICNMMPDKAWKSKLHDTGDMYNGMFIVGIETEQGQATYHYDIEPYWDMFKVKELEKAPKWDGHTPSDAISRISSISATYRKQSEWISVNERLPNLDPYGKGRYGGQRSVRVLCVCRQRDGRTFVKEGYCEPCHDGVVWRIPGSIDSVTHWMPLPEAPKMKGGAE